MDNMNEKVIDNLNHLIAICNDGKYGYQTAAEDADSAALRAMFMEYSTQRAEFVNTLQQEVRRLGGDPDKGGGPLGAIHRAWIDVKSALSSKDNKAVLGACITGEQAAVNAYDNVLEDGGLSPDLRTLLTEQRRSIEEALYRVQSLHDTVES